MACLTIVNLITNDCVRGSFFVTHDSLNKAQEFGKWAGPGGKLGSAVFTFCTLIEMWNEAMNGQAFYPSNPIIWEDPSASHVKMQKKLEQLGGDQFVGQWLISDMDDSRSLSWVQYQGPSVAHFATMSLDYRN